MADLSILSDDQLKALYQKSLIPQQANPVSAMSDDELKSAYAASRQPLQAPSNSWSDLPSKIPESAGNFASAIVQPIMHPVDTAKNLGNLALGVAEKLSTSPEQYAADRGGGGFADETSLPQGDHIKYADAAGQFFKDRYGGSENIKKTLINDPVGALADLSILFTGGGSLAIRAPGALGKIGEATASVGRIADPVNAVSKTVGTAGKLAGRTAAETLGISTGAGSMPLRTASKAGAEGGDEAKAFTENMRGDVPIESVIEQAKGAISNLRQEKNLDYTLGKGLLSQDNKPLDFSQIETAINKTNDVNKFKGIDLSPKTADVRKEITDTIDQWKDLDPKEFHTPVGLDALKQKIGDIMESHPYNTPQRLIAENAYNAIGKTIRKQAPQYDKLMKGYSQASNQIKDIERTLSLGKKATSDTSLRKLQSTMRDNVNTNYGKRADMTKTLAENGADNLVESLGGQALRSWTPRGLSRVASIGTVGSAFFNPHALAMLPAMSPRLMGELAYGAGKGAGALKKILPVLESGARVGFQIGRIQSPLYNSMTTEK